MNNKITEKQGICMVAIFILGSALVVNPGRSARENAWISIILAYILFIPMGVMYSRILEKFPGKNIFSISDILLGKLGGKLFNILITVHLFITSAALLRNLGDFIYGIGPQETPMEVNMITLGLLCILSVYGGINALGRWSIIMIPMILFVILIPIPFLMAQWELDRIIPIMYDGVGPVIKGSIETLSLPITQSFIFLTVFEDLQDVKKFKNVILKGVLLGTSVLLIIVLSTILVAGGESYFNAYIPVNVVLRRLAIGKIFERVEIVILQTFIYTIFLKCSIEFIATLKGMGHILKLKNTKAISLLVVFLAVNVATILYTNSMEGKEFISNIWPPYALTFQVGFPFILWVIAELKTRFSSG